jgi:hypothetical protein
MAGMGRRAMSSLVVVAAAGVLGGGCGGGAARPPARTAAGGARQTDATAVAVIRGWAGALARGDVAAASAYFATPSQVQISPGRPVATVRSQAGIRAVNAMLPCGAQLLDTRPMAGYIDALFLLGRRPGGDCGSGVGATARVAFLIRGGKIAVWRRVPDEPGDAARGTQPGTPRPSPAIRAT